MNEPELDELTVEMMRSVSLLDLTPVWRDPADEIANGRLPTTAVQVEVWDSDAHPTNRVHVLGWCTYSTAVRYLNISDPRWENLGHFPRIVTLDVTLLRTLRNYAYAQRNVINVTANASTSASNGMVFTTGTTRLVV